MNYTLKELLDIPRLQELLDSLSEIHILPSAIIDTEGNILTATAWQDICTRFHRVNPESEKKCIESDRHIIATVGASSQHVVYRCPMGLVDTATPIIIEGEHLGNIFTGQLFMEPPDEAYFVDQAHRYGFDEEEYLSALRKVPLISEADLHKNLTFIHNVTQMLAELCMQNMRQREAAEQLRISEERFRLGFENATIGMCLVDTTGKLLKVNRQMCEMFGYSREELENMSVNDIAHPDSQNLSPLFIRKATNGETDYSLFEKKYFHRQGHIITGQVSSSLVRDSESAPLYFISHVIDFTERKKVEDALKSMNEKYHALSVHLQTVQEQERLAISRDIHDEIGQHLTVLKLDLEWIERRVPTEGIDVIERVNEMRKSINTLQSTIQRIAADLRPPLLDELGLTAAIEWHLNELSRHSGIECYSMLNENIDHLDQETSTSVMRIVQEGVTNIARHANATEASISLCSRGGNLILEISDNGIGITPEQMASLKAYGLLGMQERARICHGGLSIRSNQGGGTTLLLTIPLNPGERGI